VPAEGAAVAPRRPHTAAAHGRRRRTRPPHTAAPAAAHAPRRLPAFTHPPARPTACHTRSPALPAPAPALVSPRPPPPSPPRSATPEKFYPYRALVQAKIAAGDARFVQIPHAGYVKHDTFGGGGAAVGPAFARALWSHLACITDGLVFNYSVAKMFEIPATGCLLLVNAEMTPVLRGQGFEPGVHYLPYTRESLDDVVDGVLDPSRRGDVDAIRRNGQNLVWARHTVSHRAVALHAHALDCAVGGGGGAHCAPR
jgi:hypothetical protein